jgi:rSAM/selenodomain-associated transferase 1
MRFPDARILIFAKVPEPGRVKTRLIPLLGAQGAADLHARLLADTVARLAPAGLAPVELWCAPDPGCASFSELANRYPLGLHPQRGADLGERMLDAAADALTRSGAVVLVGTDCPPLGRAYLARALTELRAADAVLGPAEDGGYVLLGIKTAAPVLFSSIPWGTDRVAAVTRDRMGALGWSWAELPVLWDLDRPDDLIRLEAQTYRP